MKPIPKELNLTPEGERAVQAYRDLVQRRRREGHLRKWYAEVDRLYPDLDPETRHELALSMYWTANRAAGWTNAKPVAG